jgi:hypothetical protein
LGKGNKQMNFIKNFIIIALLAFITAAASWVCDKPKVNSINDYQIKKMMYPKITFDKYCMIKHASSVAGIDDNIEFKKISEESNFSGSAVSISGALGESQLMPSIAGAWRATPWKSYENILGGAKEMKACLNSSGGNYYEAMCKYNAGKAYKRIYGNYPKSTHEYARKITGVITVAML